MNQQIVKNLPLILGVVTVITAFFGYFIELDNDFIASFYSVFGFFGGNGSTDTLQGSYFLNISAITAPLSVTALIGYIFLQNIKKWFFLTFSANEHFIICGLGDMGSALARDMLSNGKLKSENYSRLVVIELHDTNPHIEDIRHKGGIVIIGDATNKETLAKAKAGRAKTVVCFSGNDMINLETAITMANHKYQKPSLRLHLDNRENYELLRNDIFQEMNIQSFNLYDSAAQTLFMNHPLGCNVDTIEKGAVKVALVGFDKVGESILYRILNLGHFYNQIPIEVDVYDFDIETKNREFFKTYPIDHELGTAYWHVNFKDEPEFYTQELDYTQIVFCSIDSTRSFQDSMRIMKTRSSEINKNNIQTYLFSDVHHGLGELLDNDKNIFNNLYTFGNLESLCTYDVIINESLDEMAMKSNDRYNELHNYGINPWNTLSAFLKDSNRMQVEHLSIKLKVINHFLGLNEKQGDYDTIKQKALKKWFVYGGNMVWDNMKYAQYLAEYIPLEVLDKLGQVEHSRWNAFHILHGWHTLEIDETATEKIEKDSDHKLHPCLVEWDELNIVSKKHEHDYKSDDTETIMRVGDMVTNIDIKSQGLGALIREFKKFAEEHSASKVTA